MWRNLSKQFTEITKDESFLEIVHKLENIVSKVLSLALIIVILVSLVDLVIILAKDLVGDASLFFSKTLIDIFGLFLNILIALELLENITAYLRKHVIQVELVIITALIAVSRKIIIFDFSKSENLDLIALGSAILSLSVSYWLIRRLNKNSLPNE